MLTSRINRYRLAVFAGIAMLAGCGGGAAGVSPAVAPQVVPESARSWMLPEAKAEDLLYVSGYRAGVVNVYSYPSGKLVGTLVGFNKPQGECTDGSGDVFITTRRSIIEYAHGGSEPIATLIQRRYFPVACAVDPSTGNLAVSNGEGRGYGGAGSVAIYRNAQGKPLYYKNGLQYYMTCAYDNQGNLFADGLANSDEFLLELAKGGTTFKTVGFKLYGLGALAWNGNYLADEFGWSGASQISRLKISSFHARIHGVTHLDRSGNAFVIDGSRAILAVAGGVDFFEYPSGKGPAEHIRDADGATGVALSKAKP